MMHIFSLKNKTKRLPITEIAPPPLLYLSLEPHIGIPAVPVVQVGERVLKNQLIARAGGELSLNVHAPVSGTVKAMAPHIQADGEWAESIVLENDFREESIQTACPHPDTLTREDLLRIIFEAGIAGEGGAQFPTHVKYNIGDQRTIDTFIINGAECEPYLTADYALMNSKAGQLLEAAALIARLLGAKEVAIGIEKQHKELAGVFQPYFGRHKVKMRLQLLPNEYPQGGELQLIRSLTGKELRRGTLPVTAGVLVSNVGTVWAVYQAVFAQSPSTERIVTLSGDHTPEFGNLKLKIGTPLSHIIHTLGLDERAQKSRVVLGGPMMGKEVTNPDMAINKGSGGILLLKRKKTVQNNCIQCGYCVEVCPQHLMPMNFVSGYLNADYEALSADHLNDCIECGACAYICPADVPLMQSIQQGKRELNH